MTWIPRWSRLTIRARLTLVYGGLFFAGSAVLLTVVYVWMRQRVADRAGQTQAIEELRERLGPVVGGQLDAAQAGYGDGVLQVLLTQSGLALAGVSVVAVGVGWLVSGRVLRPLHEITGTARRVADSTLHERIALVGPDDEFKELADTFDAMLARLDRAFGAQRRFAANAAHELRTPLAINRTLVEVAMARPDASPDVRRLGESLLEVNARQERLITGLLTLARTEHVDGERGPIDLVELAGRVLGAHTAEAQARGIDVRSALSPASTVGDPVLVEHLVTNLIGNAVQHNQHGGRVDVGTRGTPDGAELTVSNTGPVIAEEQLATIFEPFRRLDPTPGDRGFGLGLSIARGVVDAHHGTLDASTRPGGGLLIRVSLPPAGNGPT